LSLRPLLERLSLSRRLYLMLAVAVVPLCLLVVWLIQAEKAQTRRIDHAFRVYDLSTQKNAQYQLFLGGVVDAVDTGKVSAKAVEALVQSAIRGEEIATLRGAAGTTDAAMKTIRGALTKDAGLPTLMPLRASIRSTATSIQQEAEAAQKELAQVVEASVVDGRRHAIALSITGIASLAISVLLGMALIRSVVSALRRAIATADNIAAGELNNEIEVEGHDEVAQLMHALKRMNEHLLTSVHDIQQAVEQAASGNFEHCVDLEGKQGFGLEIGEALNRLNRDLLAQVGGQPTAAVTVARQIAAGDLSVHVPVRENDETSLLAAMAAMRSDLQRVIEDIRSVVNAAAAGDFSQRMSMAGRQGYALVLTELLNRLMANAHEGLTDIQRVAAALADGDLTARIAKDYPGLVGETSRSIDATSAQLRALIGNVVNAAATIQTAAQEIAAGNQDLSRRTEDQAHSLQQTAANAAALTTTVQHNTNSAQEANVLSRESADIAARGGSVVLSSVQTMGEIAQSSHKIADIIGLIDGIAFQTNILALNAAVEAARAGESGRGFAVVASEVRSLAQRTAGAAKEIKELIQRSVEKVERGTSQARDAGKTMEEIVASIARVTQIMGDISSASAEQASGIGQVNEAVSQMEQVTQQNAALVEQAAAAAESLESQVQELQGHVARFRL
jgi:methyl-accepting chemotaxis protein